MSKLCVIFGKIRGTGGRGRAGGPAPAESAFPIWQFGGLRGGRRTLAARNRRSNGDRVRIGFKISKITSTQFKRDSAVGSRGTALPRAPDADGGAYRARRRPAAPVRPGDLPPPPPRLRPSARTVYQTPPPEFGYVVPAGARSIRTLVEFSAVGDSTLISPSARGHGRTRPPRLPCSTRGRIPAFSAFSANGCCPTVQPRVYAILNVLCFHSCAHVNLFMY